MHNYSCTICATDHTRFVQSMDCLHKAQIKHRSMLWAVQSMEGLDPWFVHKINIITMFPIFQITLLPFQSHNGFLHHSIQESHKNFKLGRHTISSAFHHTYTYRLCYYNVQNYIFTFWSGCRTRVYWCWLVDWEVQQKWPCTRISFLMLSTLFLSMDSIAASMRSRESD